jgi:hypothetical protein
MLSAFCCCLPAARFLRQSAEHGLPRKPIPETASRAPERASIGFFVATFCMFIVPSGATWAASPEYCKLYSREFVKIDLNDMAEGDRTTMTSDKIMLIYNKHFSHCLNQDKEPALPITLIGSDSYWISSILKMTNSCPPVPKIASPAPKPVATKKADSDLGPPIPHIPQKLVCSRKEYSSFALGSEEQVAWCKQNYRTYNPRTGYVVCANLKKDRCS